MDAQQPARAPILIVEDNLFSREGLAQYLQLKGYETVEASDLATAVTLAGIHRPPAAVIDIVIPLAPNQPAESHQSVGLELVRLLKASYPTIGTVIFSAHDDRGADVWAMVRDGMHGLAYIVKGSPAERITAALELVMSGQVQLDPELVHNRNQFASELLALLSPAEQQLVENAVALFPTLTPREQDVAWRVAGSHSNLSIAEVLGVKPKTIETHVANIYNRLELNKADELVPRLRKSTLLAKVCILYAFTTNKPNSPAA